jgi:hypothetical protein
MGDSIIETCISIGIGLIFLAVFGGIAWSIFQGIVG